MIKMSEKSLRKNVFLIKKRKSLPIVIVKKHLNGSEIIEKLKEKNKKTND